MSLTAQIHAVAEDAGMTADQRSSLDAALRVVLSYLASNAPADDADQGRVEVHREDVDLFVRASARTSLSAVPAAEADRLRATAPDGGSVDVTVDGGRLVTVVQVPVPDQRPAPHWS